MIYEWKSESGLRNFGDALYSEIYSEEFLKFCESSPKYLFFLIGSLICDDTLDYSEYLGKTAVFIHCGWNGRELTKEKAEKAIYIGSRGNETTEKLEYLGINLKGKLDPIYGLDILEFNKSHSKGKSHFAPHISEVSLFKDPSSFGCTDLISPIVKDEKDLQELVSMISTSEFVLSGSMHIAMLAHLLGIPFALFSSNHTQFVDHPIKWVDWLSGFSVERDKVRFVSDRIEGLDWYAQVRMTLESNLKKLQMSKVELEAVRTVITHEMSAERIQIATDYERITRELAADRDQVVLERDLIAIERDQIRIDRDRIIQGLTSELAEYTSERDQIALERDQIALERDRITLRLTSERDQIATDRDRITQVLTSKRDEIAADRDQIASERNLIATERDQIKNDRDLIARKLTSERDRIAGERDEIAADRDQLNVELNQLTSERDQILNSTIWRSTKPIRWFVNLFKR